MLSNCVWVHWIFLDVLEHGSRLSLTPLVIICDTPDTGSVTFLTYAEVEKERKRHTDGGEAIRKQGKKTTRVAESNPEY